jgi:TetR/AcrR family transcriptional regulator, transcriptional repressor of aconitase
MRHVIREAGLSAGAVYLYYKGKDELILAAISTYMAELRELLLPILANKEMLPPSAFARKITAAIASHTQRRGPDLNTIILMCWSEAQTNSEVKRLIAGFQGVFREALTAVARQWQKRGELPIAGKPRDIAKLCFRSSLASSHSLLWWEELILKQPPVQLQDWLVVRLSRDAVRLADFSLDGHIVRRLALIWLLA